MADVRGVLTQLNHALPSGVDPTRLAQWRLKEGSSYSEFRSMVANAIDGVNGEILSRWGDLIHVTFDDYLEYPTGGTIVDMPETSDLDVLDAYKGETVAHMIDLKTREFRIASSKKFLMDVRQPVLQATVINRIQSYRNLIEKAVLTRALTNTSNLLGASGYDVGWADASGTITYAPMPFGGNTFATTHNHYIGYNSSSSKTLADAFDGLAATLSEHGHEQPYTAYVAEADVTTIRGLTNYIRPTRQSVVTIDRGGATSGNQFFATGVVEATPPAGGRYIGEYDTGYGTVILRAISRLATGYVFMYKSYGQNDPRNPIYVRVRPEVGFGLRLIEEPSFDDFYPIKSIMAEVEFGVSVGRDRTAGAAGLVVAGGSWANATIS